MSKVATGRPLHTATPAPSEGPTPQPASAPPPAPSRAGKALLALEVLLKGLSVLIVLAIVSLMAYNGLVAHRAAQRAEEVAASVGPSRIEQMDALAQAYNRHLIDEHDGLDPHPAENNGWREDTDYTEQLSYPDEEVMGALHIPAIDLDLPVYHGTDEPTLAKGVGHVYGTSLPVGVEDLGASGQNASLTSHRGLPTALLFTRLDELDTGDMFSVSVLGKELTYRIDRITVVDPSEPDTYQPLMRAQMGEDRVTLITCTPFGVNTHRLIVSGARTQDPLVPARATLPFPAWMGKALLAAVAGAMTLWWWRRRRRASGDIGARHALRRRRA